MIAMQAVGYKKEEDEMRYEGRETNVKASMWAMISGLRTNGTFDPNEIEEMGPRLQNYWTAIAVAAGLILNMAFSVVVTDISDPDDTFDQVYSVLMMAGVLFTGISTLVCVVYYAQLNQRIHVQEQADFLLKFSSLIPIPFLSLLLGVFLTLAALVFRFIVTFQSSIPVIATVGGLTLLAIVLVLYVFLRMQYHFVTYPAPAQSKPKQFAEEASTTALTPDDS